MSESKLRKACLAMRDHLCNFRPASTEKIYRMVKDAPPIQPDTCKTCKWWGEPHTDPATVQRRCGQKKLGEGVMREAVDVLLAEPENYDAVILYCGPNFGCVHHEETKP